MELRAHKSILTAAFGTTVSRKSEHLQASQKVGGRMSYIMLSILKLLFGLIHFDRTAAAFLLSSTFWFW